MGNKSGTLTDTVGSNGLGAMFVMEYDLHFDDEQFAVNGDTPDSVAQEAFEDLKNQAMQEFQGIHDAKDFNFSRTIEQPMAGYVMQVNFTSKDMASPTQLKFPGMKKAFAVGWAIVKEFIGPREKVEEGKRMVEGNKVRYGQRKWDGVVVPEQLGYIDEEGNERDMPPSLNNKGGISDKYAQQFPDIDIRYRHDQDMSGERPDPYTWDESAGGEPYPLSLRMEALRRERTVHEEKLRRENEEQWKRRFREMKE